MPRYKKPKMDDDTLRMAMIGYQRRCDELLAEIAAIKTKLEQGGGRRSKTTAAGAHATSRRRKPLSAAARARISAAQKARWASYRKKEERPKGRAR